MDRPNPSPSPRGSLKAFQRRVRRNHDWNTSVGWLDGVFFALGGSLISHVTILPVFLRLLTESKTAIGVVHTLTMIGIFAPQIFSAHRIESMARKKGVVVLLGMMMRLPWLVLALWLPGMVTLPPPWPLVLFFALYLVFAVGWGLMIPPWLDLIGRIILPAKRGAFLGIRFTLGRLAAVAGAVLAFYLIKTYPFPANFALCFGGAFACLAVSLLFFSLTREVPYPVVKEKVDLLPFLRSLPEVLRRDRNFLAYNAAYALIAFTNLSLAFYAVYGVERFHLESRYAGIFTAVFMGSQALLGAVWGYLGDRYGHKVGMAVSGAMSVAAAVTALTATSLPVFYACFFFAGGYISATLIANMNLVLEFCPPEERPKYIGLANSLAAPVFAVSPVLGGRIADRWSYPALFVLTAVLVTAGLLVLLFAVEDPRRHRPAAGDA